MEGRLECLWKLFIEIEATLPKKTVFGVCKRNETIYLELGVLYTIKITCSLSFPPVENY